MVETARYPRCDRHIDKESIFFRKQDGKLFCMKCLKEGTCEVDDLCETSDYCNEQLRIWS